MSLFSFDEYRCESKEEFCPSCGRKLIETKEKEGFNAKTGNQYFGTWHSCPRYFMSTLRQLLTLGTGGMGHESHSAENSLRGREWK
jgi:hypothetical protein